MFTTLATVARLALRSEAYWNLLEASTRMGESEARPHLTAAKCSLYRELRDEFSALLPDHGTAAPEAWVTCSVRVSMGAIGPC
jgi:hypothetical protein